MKKLILTIAMILAWTAACAESSPKETEMNTMLVCIGEHTLSVRLADSQSTQALKDLLANGSLTISASNYGGFEKVCPLGVHLPSSDEYTATQSGDVMLYAGSNIVIFHGSNSWEYTRLGWIENTENLREILSGDENEITLSLE